MLNESFNSNRSESFDSEKRPCLQSCFRAAGLPHTVSVSPKLAARCGWSQSPQGGVDPYVIAWLTGLVLTGHWPHRRRQCQRGPILLLDFPAYLSAKETINLPLGIVLVDEQKLHLVDPDELDEPAPKRASVLGRVNTN